jgi:raffinose/stachyose/melibiose transport system substrate-binding protein
MRKTLKKVLCLFLAVVFILSLAACGDNSANQDKQNAQDTKVGTTEVKEETKPEDKQVTLKLWHIWPADTESNKKPFEKVLADFQAENTNIKLEIDATEAEASKTKIKVAAAANEMPDIFTYWGGGMLKSIVDAGKALPLDEYLNDGTKDRMVSGTLANMTFDGKAYGLPYSIMTCVLYVNKEMFDQNGLKLPETYSDLVAAIKGFRAKGITPMAVGGKDRWPITMYFDIMSTRVAGYQTCYDALTKKGSFEDPGILDAAKKLDELVKLKAFSDGAAGLSRDESEVPFLEGKIPMYANGNWVAGSIQKDGSKVKGKVVAMKFPVIEGGKGDPNDFTGGAADTIVASAGTQYKDETVKALKYIAENHAREAFMAGAGLPAWKVSVDESKIDPLTLQISTLASEAKTFTLWWNTLLEGQDAELYQNKLQELFISKISPEEFVKALQTMNAK